MVTLFFEDYAEKIEGDELQEVLSRMITLRKKNQMCTSRFNGT